jgi:NAD(P)-dependent dehydrogenase (short-subunit alcohol dehydrogenase family)
MSGHKPVAPITGACGGMGSACARQLVDRILGLVPRQSVHQIVTMRNVQGKKSAEEAVFFEKKNCFLADPCSIMHELHAPAIHGKRDIEILSRCWRVFVTIPFRHLRRIGSSDCRSEGSYSCALT